MQLVDALLQKIPVASDDALDDMPADVQTAWAKEIQRRKADTLKLAVSKWFR